MELGFMIWMTEAVLLLSVLGIPLAIFAIYWVIKAAKADEVLNQPENALDDTADSLLASSELSQPTQ